jgi:hypothetical protein
MIQHATTRAEILADILTALRVFVTPDATVEVRAQARRTQ